MLLSMLVLLARLIAPMMAMTIASDDPLSLLTIQTICHSDPSGQAPIQKDHTDQQDCLLCPACHLVSTALLPAPAPANVPPDVVSVVGAGPSRPPATGPPSRPSTAAQPTGPPTFSA